MPSLPTRFLSAFRTDPGRVRTNNEDLPLVDAERGVYGVIDGVGGQAAGEVAAGIACDVILQRLARPLGTLGRARQGGDRHRQQRDLHGAPRRRRDSPAWPASSRSRSSADRVLTIGHVGDSRLYKIPPGRHPQADPRPLAGRRARGRATRSSEADAMRHPRRNEVFRDVGERFGATRTKRTSSRSSKSRSNGTAPSCCASTA